MTPRAGEGASPRMGAALLLLWAFAVVLWWGFAFLPTPPGDDSWIAVAQSACFGSKPGGLPAFHGWMMLTLAPLLMLACLVVALRDDVRAALPALVHRALPRTLALVLVLAFAAEVALAAQRLRTAARIEAVSFEPEPQGPLPDGYLRVSLPVPDFALVDQNGERFDQSRLVGQVTVMSFAFAHCQTVCPVLARTLREAGRKLGPGGAQLALVTLDPWRDTPAALPALAEHFQMPPEAHMLSGPPDDVCRLLDTLGVARERDLRTGDVNHAPLVFVLDAAGRITYRFNNPPAHWIVEAARRARRPA